MVAIVAKFMEGTGYTGLDENEKRKNQLQKWLFKKTAIKYDR